MIAKRIMRGKAGDFGRLGEYIVNGDTKGNSNQGALALGGKVAEEAAIWQRTADYIVDALAGGQRACIVRITNCRADNLEDAIAEITATQTINRRAKGDRTYHLVVSFPPGETPTPEQLRDIEDELCRAIGLGKHQRISAVHADTKHLHMHIAINQVHPETRACIEPWQDRPKLMRACDLLEIKHGLTRTNHSRVRVESQPGLAPNTTAASTIDKTPVGAKAMERHGGLETLLSWVRREAAPSLLTVVATGAGWQDLHRVLAEHGLEIRRRGAGLIIASGKTAIKASDVDRLLSMKALRDKWGEFERAGQLAEVQVKKTYRRGPMHREVDELFEDWQATKEKFSGESNWLIVEIARRAEINRIWKEKELERVRNSPYTSFGRVALYNDLERDTIKMLREEKQWISEQRAKLREKHHFRSWPEYRAGSVCLNKFQGSVKWISALIILPPGLAAAH